jgi:ribonuclease-3
MDLSLLEENIEHIFSDKSLLKRALTHRSYRHEHQKEVEDNELLEFLGDSVIGLIISELLFRRFPRAEVGAIVKAKSYLVSARVLSAKAQGLGLGDFILIGIGEEKSRGRRKLSLLANAYEALIAAIYLDGGIDEVSSFIEREFAENISSLDLSTLTPFDYKSAFQELLQDHSLPLPDYVVIKEEGPPHKPVFEIGLFVNRKEIARAKGKTKKSAEQLAARQVLDLIKKGVLSLDGLR